MPGMALSWSAVAVLISIGAAAAAAVAAAGLGVVWAEVKTGVRASRTAAASSLRRRLNIGGSPFGLDTLLRKGTREWSARQCACSRLAAMARICRAVLDEFDFSELESY